MELIITILTYLFYSFAAFAIMWETSRFFGFNPLKQIKELTEKVKEEAEYNKKIDEAEVGDELFLKSKKFEAAIQTTLGSLALILFSIVYFVWTILGLTSSQYMAFLCLIILSFIYGIVQKIVGTDGLAAEVALRVDAAASLCLLIYILISRFQGVI